MKLSTLAQEAWVSIGGNRLRTFLAMLGIIIGVASIVAMIAISQGGREVVRRAIASLGTNMLVVTPGKEKEKGLQTLPAADFSLKDIAFIDALPSVAASAASTDLHNSLLSTAKAGWNANIAGVTSNFFFVYNWPFTDGGNFTANQFSAHDHVIIIGQTVAAKLFPRAMHNSRSIVGETVNIEAEKYRVIGVLDKKGKDLDGVNQDNIAFIPLTSAETVLGDTSSWGDHFIGRIFVRAASHDMLDVAEEDIASALRRRQHMQEIYADNFTVSSMESLTKVANDTSQALTLLLSAIASISLIVGGIGITNIMLVTVSERTHEIGIRKAIGATNMHILLQFLYETVMITSIGCGVGLFCGLGSAWAAHHWFNLEVMYDERAAIMALGMAVIVGVISGLYPAYKAALLQPIEALRAA